MKNARRSSRDDGDLRSSHRPPIVLTNSDRDSLLALCDASANVLMTRFLCEEIARADIAPDDVAPTSVVRIGSSVKFVDHAEGRARRATLVFPEHANNNDCVSVLSPVGSALIGLGPGQSIQWMEQGGERSLAVLEVSADKSHSSCMDGKKR